jgi:D-alanyl-D-alanine carboxypeptidase
VADGYPGVVGLVRDGADTQYAHAGVGDITTKVPADPKARFRIGSNSKAFTSAVLLQLEAEGKLSLDDTVDRWLPGAVHANGYEGASITVRQLLNHTSGLPDYLKDTGVTTGYYLNTNPRQEWAPQKLVDIALALHAPQSAPGEKWGYSNTNYLLAGMVVKAVTGSDVSTEIQHRVIEPLGLADTAFPTDDPTIPGNHLSGYDRGVPLVTRDVTTSNVQLLGSAGAIVSTLDDLAAFGRALLDGTLLEPAQLKELKTTVPVAENSSVGYGLGIEHEQLDCGTWVWGHNGAVLGYFSEWLSTEDGTREVLHANNEYHMLSPTKGQTDTGQAMLDAFCAK